MGEMISAYNLLLRERDSLQSTMRAAVAFLESWERENSLHNSDSADSETYFYAAVKTSELAMAFRLSIPTPNYPAAE